VDAARKTVDSLAARIAERDAAARGHYVNADAEAGHAAAAEADALRAEHAAASSRLTVLTEAALAVALEVQQDAWRASLAAVRQQLAEQRDESERQLAVIRPAVSAVKAAIIAARAAEAAARRLDAEQMVFEHHLGLREGNIHPSAINRVDAVVSGSPLLLSIVNSTEY
jgi:hypothetical protein